ncbi:MAG: TIGR01620 family protein [Hyphomicrobiaceae bacterium]|nr:TIGR01620 family protein [Hyphomicrobiaceae bacterium]
MSPPNQRRRPRVFSADDPSVAVDAYAEQTAGGEEAHDPDRGDAAPTGGIAAAGTDAETGERATVADRRRGIGWGGILLSALTGLAMLGIGAWFARLVSAALARQDWVGWTAYGLLLVALVSGGVLVIKELVGLSRLTRLAGLKRDLTAAIAANDARAERQGVKRLRQLYSGRADLRWGLKRFAEHEKDVHDPGALVALAERELVAPLDGQARRAILKSAKRVSVVTALSPIFLFAVLFVLVENVRMLRGLATLYGGRPGLIGALRLGRMVVTHIIATGGLAMTDDLLGQFLGQDLVRRLSQRLGEGLFNGALTARIGAAAIEVCRPLPFIEASPVRVREIIAELARRQPTRSEATAKAARETGRRID